MKITLLNPPNPYSKSVVRDTLYGCWCKGRASYSWMPIGLAYMAAVLGRAFHRCQIIDAGAERMASSKVAEKIYEFRSNLVVINTATITFSDDIKVAKFIKKSLSVPICFVGTHVTLYPKETLNAGADYVVTGEPEYGLRDLVEDLAVGITSKKIYAGRVIKDLDKLPYPARDLYPANAGYFNPLAKKNPFETMISSRGCPFQCIYCTASILYGRKFRFRSAENVVDEMEHLRDEGVKEILFRDEGMTVNRERMDKISDGIIDRGLDMSWICNSRVDTVRYTMLSFMKTAGCHTIKFGVESGNQQILNNLKKGITLEQTRNAFKWCRDSGIKTVAHFMLGSPGETKETIQQTIDFVMSLDADYISPNITYPSPGTELWKTVEKKMGKYDWKKWNLDNMLERATFNELWSEVSKKDLDEAFTNAYKRFYYRPSYMLKSIGRVRSFNDVKRLGKAGLSLFRFVGDRNGK